MLTAEYEPVVEDDRVHLTGSRSRLVFRVLRPLLLLPFLLAQLPHDARGAVTRISWDSRFLYNRFVLEFDQDVTYNPVDAVKDKGYFYVDIYGVTANYKRRVLDVEDSTLRKVEALSYPDHGVLRFVFYVKEQSAGFSIRKEPNPTRLFIDTIRDASTSVAAAPTPGTEESPTRKSATLSAVGTPSAPIVIRDPAGGIVVPPIPEPQKRGAVPRPTARAGKEKCVIIDPGHGGANQGAKSATTINGKQVFEKDLVFQFAYHLKKVIDNSPNMIAFLTRSDDSLVALGDRVSFAEKHQGDIFVSLHLNDGAGNPNARGVEIFYLSEKGTVDGAAKAVEERENTDIGASSAASKGSTPLVKRILTDLERGKLEEWQYESYLACKRIIETFQQLPFFRNNNRGVKNANFLVLKNFYMPSVLLEIGFITNSQDLQYLVNPQFQRQTATLLYNALNDIFAENDPSFKAHHLKLTGGSGR